MQESFKCTDLQVTHTLYLAPPHPQLEKGLIIMMVVLHRVMFKCHVFNIQGKSNSRNRSSDGIRVGVGIMGFDPLPQHNKPQRTPPPGWLFWHRSQTIRGFHLNVHCVSGAEVLSCLRHLFWECDI